MLVLISLGRLADNKQKGPANPRFSAGLERILMDAANHELSGTPASQEERRRFQRYTVQVQIELHEEGSDIPLRLETTDLSRGGCYIQLMMTLSLGAYVSITLWLDDCPVRIRGRVVTRHPQFGNGIVFLEFQGNGEQVLTRYLDAVTV